MSLPTEHVDQTAAPRPARVISLIVLAGLALVAVGYWFYHVQEVSLRRQIEQTLATVARIHSERVAQWRHDQWLDAGILAGNPFLGDGLLQVWNDSDTGLADELDTYLRHIQREHDYAEILIVDRDGRVRHFLESDAPLPPSYSAAVEQAMQRRQRVFVDELEALKRGGVPFATVAPLYALDGDGNAAPSGALVLVNDVNRFLFPFIELWPTQSATGETLLVKRSETNAFVLNRDINSADLPREAGNVLPEEIPADLDRQMVAEFSDYRGNQVLAAVVPVPDSDWLIVSKQDTAEAFALWHVRSALILVAFGAVAISFSAMGFVFWLAQRRRHFEDLYRSESQRRAAAERYGVMLRSIGDGVIVTDEAGNVEFMNETAESLTGWANAEAVDRPLHDVFRIYDGQTREELENPLDRVRREGDVVGLALDTWLVSRDGSERPIADSSAPVRDDAGDLTGAVLVFQDQTGQHQARTKLEASEARHRLLIESAPDAIFVQVEGRFAYLNPACLAVIGAPDEASLLGQPVLERFHPAFRDGVQNRIRKLNEDRKPVCLVPEDLLTLSGEIIPAEVSAVPIEFDGQPGALVYVRDISVRKSAEVALQQNLEMLQRTERIARVGSWEWEFTNDTVRWSNELYRILGMDPAQPALAFAEHAKLYLPDDFERLQEAVNRCFESGTPYTLELQAVRADGAIRWCVAHGEADIDSEGRIRRLVGSLQDITGRKELEETLRRSEEKFRSLFDNHTAVKLLIDPRTGKIIDANKAAARFYGWTVDELQGMNISQINELAPEELRYELDAARRAKKPHFEFQHRKADGSVADVEVFSSTVSISGEEVLHSIVHDISEKRRIESEFLQVQKMESVGRLAGGVAHDFNNMLSVIMGHAQIAMEELDSSSSLYSDLNEIVTAGKRSTEIARQLLAFARKQTISPVVLDLNETTSSMLKMLQRLIGEDIELVWAPGNDPWNIKIDPIQVDQILVNLCVNARDAIEDVGRIAIETENVSIDHQYCAVHPEFKPGEYVLLSVSDDGVGMDRETREQIFEPFFTTKEIGRGTGMGLSTVYGIVKQNDGFIHVYSEPGEGTIFSVYFARYLGRIAEATAPEASELPTGNGETVLVVEDEPAMLSLAKRMLEKVGYNVVPAATPKEALQAAEECGGKFDLLLTDVVMPGMNGRDLANALTEHNPGLRVLFMSGYTADVIAHRGVINNSSALFVQKPFSQSALAAKVREALDMSNSGVANVDS